MTITKLAHFSVRATNLEASKRFYIDILGFKEGFRPAFPFPGAWLYRGGDESEFGTVHIIGIDPTAPDGLANYLGDRGLETLHGSGAVDHLAFLATGLQNIRSMLTREHLAFRERTVPGLKLHQVFMEDPSGVTIELNFPASEVRA